MADNDQKTDAQSAQSAQGNGAQGNSFDPDAFAEKMMERFKNTFPTAGANGNAGSASQSAPTSGTSNDQVLQAVQALPEAMVNSFREAFTKPSSGQSGDGGSQKDEKQSDNETKEPGTKSFIQRWFG